MEAEEIMLQKLKIECGINAVSKIMQMFKDMQLSRDLQAQFRENKGGTILGNVDFAIEVL